MPENGVYSLSVQARCTKFPCDWALCPQVTSINLQFLSFKGDTYA